MAENEFPRYLMKIGNEMKFLPLREAGIALDNGYERVESINIVLLSDFSARRMTREEQTEMQRIADQCSASK